MSKGVIIEKRFQNFNYNETKKKLFDLGFYHFGDHLFQIIIYTKLEPNQRIIVRDEGFGIIFTISNIDSNGQETEYKVNVSDYTMINKMLTELKLEKKYELQSYREIYKTLDHKTKVIFDNFPGLLPYMKIESKTEQDLFETMEKLGVSEETNFSYIDLYSEYYGITIDIPFYSLTFKDADKYFHQYITKNKEEFYELLYKQQEKFLSKK